MMPRPATSRPLQFVGQGRRKVPKGREQREHELMGSEAMATLPCPFPAPSQC